MNAPGDKYPDLLSNISIAVTTADTLEDTFAPVLRLVCEATGWTTGHALTVSSEGAPQSTGIWHGAASFPKTLLDQFQTDIEAERVSGVKGLAERVLADGLPKWVSGAKPIAWKTQATRKAPGISLTMPAKRLSPWTITALSRPRTRRPRPCSAGPGTKQSVAASPMRSYPSGCARPMSGVSGVIWKAESRNCWARRSNCPRYTGTDGNSPSK